MTKTSVFIRPLKQLQSVNITSSNKPNVLESIKIKWQKLINLAASYNHVPAGLIMKITETDMEIFLKSSNHENPYLENGKDSLGHGLYCETVIGSLKSLTVTNSLLDPIWKNNPDVKLNMIAYYGLPLVWPDNEVFGTICLLDNKENQFGSQYEEFMTLIKEIIETDLQLLYTNSQLEYISNMDALTNIPNRKKIIELLNTSILEYHQNKSPFTVVMFDINGFKHINDQYGHKVGDYVLMEFAHFILQNIQSDVTFGRYGGDEFVLIFPRLSQTAIIDILGDIKLKLKSDKSLRKYNVTFSYGVCEMNKNIIDAIDFLDIADQKMYEFKRIKAQI